MVGSGSGSHGAASPWKKITITPVDISVKTRHSEELVERIGQSPKPVAQYIKRFHRKQPPGADPNWVPGCSCGTR